MARFLLLVCLSALLLPISFSNEAAAQDTVSVQTLTFDSITTRRGVWDFPDNGDTYRKILMYYTLKCDPATTQDNYNCGEWDYLTYSYLYDHTGALDSTLLTHPTHMVGNEGPDTYDYTTNQTYEYYITPQYTIVYDTVYSEVFDTLTIGSSTSAAVLGGDKPTGRAQFLYTASELTSAGLIAGDINRLALDLATVGSDLDYFTIRLAPTSSSSLDGFVETAFTEVFEQHTGFSGSGWHTFDFHTPFAWNGTSNVLVEFSFSNDAIGSANTVSGDVAGFDAGVYAHADDHFISIEGPSHVGVPVDNIGSSVITDQITVSFWQYGDPNIQPQNDYIFEGRDASGNRVVNVHLPWSNGRVYWDAGNEGGSYDRIDKLANTSNYAGQWNHWAFTKNSTTGQMRIYLNGQQWHQGNGMTRPLNEIATFAIGANASDYNGSYDGFVDEFRVWNTALDAQTIQDWMYTDVDNSHPNFANLIAYYDFNEGAGGSAADQSGVAGTAGLIGGPQWMQHNGTELFRNAVVTEFRPNLILVQGDYASHIDTTWVTDTVAVTPTSIVEFTTGTFEAVPVDTTYVWDAGFTYVYQNGVVVDSVNNAMTATLTNGELQYYGAPFEVIDRYEIGRFITPYGIGLDLGPNGFTWVYDVTDYAPLLRGAVDMQHGNQQELIDVRFDFITGTPPREVKQLDRIWGQSGSYSYFNLDEDNSLSNTTIDLHPDAEQWKVKTRFTGHGHQSNTGNYPHCCEWKDNEHYLYVNGSVTDAWHVWQATECANNPVYPQGGTWPGAREGWCPGATVPDYEFEITDNVSGSSVDLDYDITPVPANNAGMGSGNYIVAMHLLQYGANAHDNDLEILDVIRPTNWEFRIRENPICHDPTVVIRNNGSQQVTSATIEYGVVGGTAQTYEWSGFLDPHTETEVNLPIPGMHFWIGDDSNTFFAEVSAPNGNADEYSANNRYETNYDKPDFYEENFVIELNTNNRPNENSIYILDVWGNVVWERTNLQTNAWHRDTLELAQGCYTLRLDDSGLDGLSYWADPNAGSGQLRLKGTDGSFLKFFESEFGGFLSYSFSIGAEVSVDEVVPGEAIHLYPNPTAGAFTLEMLGYNGSYNVQVIDAVGRIVANERLTVNTVAQQQFDLSDFGAGIYSVRISNGDDVVVKKVVVE